MDYRFRKIMDLDELLNRIIPLDEPLQQLRPGLGRLSSYATEYLYSGRSATKRDTQSAIRQAHGIRKENRTRLGLLA